MILKENVFYLIDNYNMKNIFYILILLITFLFSCKKDTIEKPKNFIPKDKMIALLVDMKIANKTKTIKTKKLEKDLNYMSYIFEKHNIDSTQFKENNEYYIYHIVQYEDIYIEVQKRIKDSLAKYKKIVKTKDSLDRVKRKLAKKQIEIGPELMLKMKEEKTNPKIKPANKK